MTDLPALPEYGVDDRFRQSYNAALAVIAVIIKRFPQDVSRISEWSNGYTDVLAGTRQNVKPFLTSEQIAEVGRDVLNGWRWNRFPLPGDFEDARDAAMKRAKLPPVSNEESSDRKVAWDAVMYAARKKQKSAIPEVMDVYWQAQIDKAMLDVDLADQPAAKARVAEILAR